VIRIFLKMSQEVKEYLFLFYTFIMLLLQLIF